MSEWFLFIKSFHHFCHEYYLKTCQKTMSEDCKRVIIFCLPVWDADRLTTLPRKRQKGNNGTYSKVSLFTLQIYSIYNLMWLLSVIYFHYLVVITFWGKEKGKYNNELKEVSCKYGLLSVQGKTGDATVPQSWGAEFIKSTLQEEPY